MKVFTILIASILSFMIASKNSEAGDYHTGSTLICATCHTMHYSITHEAHTTGIHDKMGTSGPYQKLLRDQVNNLCLMCHDGKGGGAYGWPDVLGPRSGGPSIRQAGMLNTLTSSTPYEHWKGHTLGSTNTAPGGAFNNSQGFTCIDCHDHHGTLPSQYRNLLVSSDSGDKFYNKSITYATMTNDLTRDVFQKTPSGFTGTGCAQCHAARPSGNRYNITDISFNEPNPTQSAMGAWCKSCHTNFHGQGGDSNMGGRSGGDINAPWLRHPTADVNIGANSNIHSSYPIWSTGWDINKRVQTMSSSGVYPSTDNTPHCLSCHRGHGSVNPFGLIYTNPDGTLAIESAQSGANLPNTCKQCHDS